MEKDPSRIFFIEDFVKHPLTTTAQKLCSPYIVGNGRTRLITSKVFITSKRALGCVENSLKNVVVNRFYIVKSYIWQRKVDSSFKVCIADLNKSTTLQKKN